MSERDRARRRRRRRRREEGRGRGGAFQITYVPHVALLRLFLYILENSRYVYLP